MGVSSIEFGVDSYLTETYYQAMAVIEWTRRAMKQLRQIAKAEQPVVYSAVDALRSWPDCRNVKALVGCDEYRLRVGRYRIIFSIHGERPRIVRIEEVKKRDERTY